MKQEWGRGNAREETAHDGSVRRGTHARTRMHARMQRTHACNARTHARTHAHARTNPEAPSAYAPQQTRTTYLGERQRHHASASSSRRHHRSGVIIVSAHRRVSAITELASSSSQCHNRISAISAPAPSLSQRHRQFSHHHVSASSRQRHHRAGVIIAPAIAALCAKTLQPMWVLFLNTAPTEK